MKTHNWKLSYYRTIYGSFRTMYAPMGTSFDWCVPSAQVCLFIHTVDKSTRNLKTSSLKQHWDSHSRNASNSSFLGLSSHPSSGCIPSTAGLSCLYFFSSSTGTFLHLFCVPLLLWRYGRQNTAALGWVHPTMPISTPSKGLAKISSYSYGLYLVTPGKLASTIISKPDFKCIKIWLQPRTTASPTASTILLKSPTQNHPVVFANSHSLVWR